MEQDRPVILMVEDEDAVLQINARMMRRRGYEVRTAGTCRAEAQAVFTLGPGQFVIFLPGEPHSPGNPAGEPSDCKKAVIKVRC